MTEPSYRPDRRNPPDRRKEDYDQLDKKIDERFDDLTDRLERFIRRALIAFAIIGVTCAIGLFGFALVLHREGNNADNIQAQRKETILRGCTEQNVRHDNTYNSLVAAAKIDEDNRKTEAGKQEVRRRRDVTLALIDVLTPKQNCDTLVAKSVKGA